MKYEVEVRNYGGYIETVEFDSFEEAQQWIFDYDNYDDYSIDFDMYYDGKRVTWEPWKM